MAKLNIAQLLSSVDPCRRWLRFPAHSIASECDSENKRHHSRAQPRFTKLSNFLVLCINSSCAQAWRLSICITQASAMKFSTFRGLGWQKSRLFQRRLRKHGRSRARCRAKAQVGHSALPDVCGKRARQHQNQLEKSTFLPKGPCIFGKLIEHPGFTRRPSSQPGQRPCLPRFRAACRLRARAAAHAEREFLRARRACGSSRWAAPFSR